MAARHNLREAGVAAGAARLLSAVRRRGRHRIALSEGWRPIPPTEGVVVGASQIIILHRTECSVQKSHITWFWKAFTGSCLERGRDGAAETKMTELLLLCAFREEDLEPMAARSALFAASNR